MDATLRTYGTAGLALATAGVIAVTPVASQPDLHLSQASHAGVQLTNAASDALAADLDYFDWSSLTNPTTLSNIAQNLLIDIVNIPYNWLKAVDFYSKAGLGYPGVYGTDQEPGSYQYDPQHPNPELAGSAPNALTGTPADPAQYQVYGPIGPMDGTDAAGDPVHSYVPIGFGGTGSWWMESTGNTWGWDEGNFGQVLGLGNIIVPIPQFSTPFAYSLQAAAMQQIVPNPEACPFECPDILGYLGRWFNVPLNDMFSGVTVGNEFGPYSDDPTSTAVDPTDEPISPMGLPIGWAGQTVQFDPFFFITSFLKSLAMDPSTNLSPVDAYGSLLSDPTQLYMPFVQVIEDLFNDFVPVLNGSFVYWGAPSLYTVPAFWGGIISSFTGFANPMKDYTLAPGGAFALGPYVNPDGDPTPIVGGEVPPMGDPDVDPHLTNPLDLFAAIPAGFANWIGGLLGYLDPYTYLAGLGVTSDMDATQLADQLGIGTGLADGLFGWHEGLHDAAIGPLADLSNLLTPWYTDLTFGMQDLLTS